VADLVKRGVYVAALLLAIALASTISYLVAYTQHNHYPLIITAQGELNGEEQSSTLRTITVTGVGTASAKPNRAVIWLGVLTSSSEAAEAVRQNAEASTAVIETLKALGILEEDIETARYSLYPKYSHDRLVGFTAVHILKVTTTHLDSVGLIIDEAVKAGANRVERITFTFDDETLQRLKDEARLKAVEDAEKKVALIADALGVKVLGVAKVEEIYLNQPRYTYFDLALTIEGAQTPIIPPSKATVTAIVKITFIIG